MRFKDTFFTNESFTNSKDLSVDACKYSKGEKGLYEDYTTNRRRINILKYKNENNNTNVNVVKSNVYKTLLAIPQNEIDYINNIEINNLNNNDKLIYNSDDEGIITRNRNNINTKIIEYSRRSNKCLSNYNNSDRCNYNHFTEDINRNEILKNKNGFRSNYTLRKRTNYTNEINNNNDNNNYSCRQGISRYTYYRHISNIGDSSNRTYQNQGKSQLKTILINKNRKRKLFRFEEGKGVKVIYQ